jgi:hypothetical protein
MQGKWHCEVNTLKQNGVDESKNRTFVKSVQCMLQHMMVTNEL